MIKDVIQLAVGFFAGGAVTAMSSKLLGWFNKQETSIETKIP